jgi:hypothetical protein
MIEYEPDLPEGYSWQFIDVEGQDCTRNPVYAVADAANARIWRESGDLVLALKRANSYQPWEVEEGTDCGRKYADLDEAVAALTEAGAFATQEA